MPIIISSITMLIMILSGALLHAHLILISGGAMYMLARIKPSTLKWIYMLRLYFSKTMQL